MLFVKNQMHTAERVSPSVSVYYNTMQRGREIVVCRKFHMCVG